MTKASRYPRDVLRGYDEGTHDLTVVLTSLKHRAAGALVDEFHMTPQQAKEVLRQWQAEQAAKQAKQV